MKYSLKNRQFKRRNDIFGERKKQRTEPIHQENWEGLEQIKEIREETEQSNFGMNYQKDLRNEKLYQFINFQNSTEEPKVPLKKQQKKNNGQHRCSRHGLSPINKPLLNNTQIRLAESTAEYRRSKILGIESQAVSFHYRPQIQLDHLKEIKTVVLKLFSILIKNNQRVDLLQRIVSSIIEKGQLMAKQLNQGMGAIIKIQQKTDLFFNTMRSVYQNLRICKLKQENLELYLKQIIQEKTQTRSYLNEPTIKNNKSNYSLANKYFQQNITKSQKQSRQLSNLIDYESDSSFYQINVNQQTLNSYSPPVENDFKKHYSNSNNEYLLEHFKLGNDLNSMNNTQFQQLSPFDANRMISATNHSVNHTRVNTPNFIHSKLDPSYHQSQYQTSKSQNNSFQINPQYQILKSWLQKTNQKGLKCWLDEMGCLRRSNNTYIFNENGEVITVPLPVFRRLIDEGFFSSVKL